MQNQNNSNQFVDCHVQPAEYMVLVASFPETTLLFETQRNHWNATHLQHTVVDYWARLKACEAVYRSRNEMGKFLEAIASTSNPTDRKAITREVSELLAVIARQQQYIQQCEKRIGELEQKVTTDTLDK